MERLILLASNSNNNINEGNLNSNNNFNLNLNSNSNHNIKSSNTNLTTEITIIKGKIDGKFNQFDRKSLDSLINLIIIMVNIATAVGIVVANKLVFTKYSFKYGLTLTIIHFIITWISLHILSWWFGLFQRKKLRIFDILPLCASFCGFVVLTNVSLLLNSVSFYQVILISILIPDFLFLINNQKLMKISSLFLLFRIKFYFLFYFSFLNLKM